MEDDNVSDGLNYIKEKLLSLFFATTTFNKDYEWCAGRWNGTLNHYLGEKKQAVLIDLDFHDPTHSIILDVIDKSNVVDKFRTQYQHELDNAYVVRFDIHTSQGHGLLIIPYGYETLFDDYVEETTFDQSQYCELCCDDETDFVACFRCGKRYCKDCFEKLTINDCPYCKYSIIEHYHMKSKQFISKYACYDSQVDEIK